MKALDIIFLIVAIILIIITLLQGGKSEGASGAITGGGLNVFVKTKERGVDKVMSYITFGLAALFFLLAILANVL
ncbi:MAG: preprotein translocase subunit SecG [Bacilli bacterium]|jgi:preprotein translocase subunit SecG